MLFRYEYQDGVWVDCEQPNEDELHEVIKEFSISARVETELSFPTPTPLVINDSNAVLLVLHFLAHSSEDEGTKNQEIDFIVGDHFIVTVRYEVVAPLHRLKKLLETHECITEDENITTDILLEILFAHLYASVRDHINHIASHLTRVEKDMFGGHERTTVRAISIINREFLHSESTLADQEEPLHRFFETLTRHDFFDDSFKERAKRMLADWAQVARSIATHRAIAAELRETNTALLGAHQNEIMKTLTVITFSVLPLELITLIFGMHAAGTPLEQNPHAFWIIIAFMLGIVGCMTLLFARKRWLF